jgi:hypothetical protein
LAKLTVFAYLSLFHSVKTVQNSENSQYPNASKCFQIAKTAAQYKIAKTVSWSPAICYMIIIIGFYEGVRPASAVQPSVGRSFT